MINRPFVIGDVNIWSFFTTIKRSSSFRGCNVLSQTKIFVLIWRCCVLNVEVFSEHLIRCFTVSSHNKTGNFKQCMVGTTLPYGGKV